MSGKKVLVVGGGGREHALAWRLAASDAVSEVLVAPGNAGTAGVDRLRNVSGDPLTVALAERPDLVVVGPEAPLCAGLVDELEAGGLLVFGPSRAAAQLEASKSFMKDFAKRHEIRTAEHRVATSSEAAEQAIREFAEPPVVKADGLAAGKGVVVAESHGEAIEAAREMLDQGRFGEAGATVVLEERLLGAEASVHAICDGERVFVLPPAQDHKRIGEGDTGPNTGGMGTYTPAPLVSPELAARIEAEVMQRAVTGMARDGHPFRGALFAGLMISDDGEPCLLEFNVRFGDPETQVLMSVLDGDFFRLLESAAAGRLDPSAVTVSDRHALCVVLAAAGYPGTPRKGDEILGVDTASGQAGVEVFHAGTKAEAGKTVVSGGRVLGVTASASDLETARARAYGACESIEFPGRQLRRDIGARALAGR